MEWIWQFSFSHLSLIISLSPFTMPIYRLWLDLHFWAAERMSRARFSGFYCGYIELFSYWFTWVVRCLNDLQIKANSLWWEVLDGFSSSDPFGQRGICTGEMSLPSIWHALLLQDYWLLYGDWVALMMISTCPQCPFNSHFNGGHWCCLRWIWKSYLDQSPKGHLRSQKILIRWLN